MRSNTFTAEFIYNLMERLEGRARSMLPVNLAFNSWKIYKTKINKERNVYFF